MTGTLLRRSALIPVCVLILSSLGCGRKEKEQERRMAQEIQAMTQAVAKNEALPPVSNDPEAYGRGRELMLFIHERLARAVLTNNEMASLAKDADRWIQPQEWTSPERIKELRTKATRMVMLMNQSSTLMDETMGEAGLSKIRAMDLRPSMKAGVLDSLQARGDALDTAKELLAASRSVFERREAILALADEKGVKVEDGVPKFPSGEDAVRYRTLVQEEQGDMARIQNVMLRFQGKAQELLKDAGAK
jgi:hypothetical protein